MKQIEEIVKVIDEELITSNKRYLLLGKANKLLVEKGIFSTIEVSKKELKKILENGEIKHAYISLAKIKQWRIPLSYKEKERVQHKTINTYKTKNELKNTLTICPSCGSKSKFGNHCKNCENYIVIPKKSNRKNKPLNVNSKQAKFSKKQRNWIIITIVIVVIYLISYYNDDVDNQSTSSYYVNTSTYVATSKQNFDQLFHYLSDNDEEAVIFLLQHGQVKLLTPGTEVYLINANLSYSIIRLNGSTEKLWIITEHLSKK